MQLSVSEETRAFRSIRRACYAGLDSVTLRTRVAAEVAAVIPAEARTMATTDPETGLFTHAVAAGLPATLTRAWLEHLYPLRVAGEIIDMARSRTVATRFPSAAVMGLLRQDGFGHDLRAVLAERSGLWGFCCLLRETTSPSFNDRDLAFMRRIAPHLTAGLRAAALLDGAQVKGGAAPPGEQDGAGGGEGLEHSCGVLVLDERGSIVLQNAAASYHLKDLEDVGREPGVVPYAIGSAVVRLHLRHASASPEDAEPLQGGLRVRGRSGRWLTIRASLAEPNADSASHTIVLIEPAQRSEVAGILTKLYGLSPREREILAFVAMGEPTKRIAARLKISPYTVQEHLGNACTKVGVRSRKALLAKLFFEGYARALQEAEGGIPAASGDRISDSPPKGLEGCPASR